MSIRRLLMIAAPSGTGKSLLFDSLRLGLLPHVAEQFGISDIESWSYKLALEVAGQQEVGADQVILHYDILRPWRIKTATRRFEEDPALRILADAEEIILLTLYAPADTLFWRYATRRHRVYRRIKRRKELTTFPVYSPLGGIEKPLKLLALLHHRVWLLRTQGRNALRRDPLQVYYKNRIASVYDKWFEYCAEPYRNNHWVVDTLQSRPFAALNAAEAFKAATAPAV